MQKEVEKLEQTRAKRHERIMNKSQKQKWRKKILKTT